MGKPTGMCLWRSLFRKGDWDLGRGLSRALVGFNEGVDYRTDIESQAALGVPRALVMIWLHHTFGALSSNSKKPNTRAAHFSAGKKNPQPRKRLGILVFKA